MNKTGPEAVAIDLIAGTVVLDSDVMNGPIVVRGVGTITDNSTGTATVDTTALISNASIATELLDTVLSGHTLAGSAGAVLADILRIMENRLEVDFVAQELVLYDDDGVTPIRRWPLETSVGEDVATAAGVQTKRKASII